jgi:undecaprenyl-phosphate galactose phosphotransferase
MPKSAHRLLLIALDTLVYIASFLITNCLFELWNLNTNLQSLANTGWLFNIALPVSIVVLCFLNRRLYSFKPYLFWDELIRLIKATLIAIVLIFVLLFVFQVNNIKTSVTISLFIFMALDPVARYFYRILMVNAGLLRTNVLIIGTGAQGRKFHSTVTAHKFTTYNVIGYLDDHRFGAPGEGMILGRLNDIPKVLRKYRVDEAVIAIPKATRDHFQQMMKMLEMQVKTIRFIPDMFGVLTFSPEITDFDRVLTISASQGLLDYRNRILKRILDIGLGLVGALLLVPLHLLVTFLVKIDDQGKVVFTQNRIGRNGKPIRIYKFRTMVENAEQVLKDMMERDPAIREAYERDKKLENDPRITRIGNILRKTSLDEFPQFLNVLKGEMSFVGPRPYLFNEIKDMEDKYDSIIKIKPGITGLWQATGRNDISFDERVVLDQYYVRNWTIWFDFVIILRTVLSVLTRKGVKG